jgi:hypothetical protein
MNKKRWIPAVLAVLLLLLVVVAYCAPLAKSTASISMSYTDTVTGNVFVINGDPATVTVLQPPKVEGVPSSVVTGTKKTLTASCDVGDKAFSYTVYLPTYHGTYTANSLHVNGTTATVLEVTQEYVKVQLSPLADNQSTIVILNYEVGW